MSILNKIQQIKDKFEFNMEDSSVSSFPTTKTLLNDFKSIFNTKALAVATLMGFTSLAAAHEPLPLSSIQESFQSSMKIQNIYYNEKLPTYFENQSRIVTNNQNVTLKNEYWHNNIVTLIRGNITTDDVNPVDLKKYGEQINYMNDNTDSAFYVRLSVDDVKSFYTNKDDYKHYFRNDYSKDADFLNLYSKNSIQYIDAFITYHEMAHSSFEQEQSSINPKTTLNLVDEIRMESHSDISSLLMVSTKYGLNFDQFKEFALDLVKVRSEMAYRQRDFEHNTALVIVELVNTFEQNKDLYYKMNTDKISSFSAYFVHNVFEQDQDKLINNMKKAGLSMSITDFLDKFEIARKELLAIDAKGQNILQTPLQMKGVNYYTGMVEDIYYRRNPELLKKSMEAIEKGDYLAAGKIKIDMFSKFMTQTEREKEIFAVEANKIVKAVNFRAYSNYMSQVIKPEFIKETHQTTALNDYFKKNQKELENIVLKNKATL